MRKFLAALLLLPALACAQILGGATPSTGFGATPGISGQTTQPSFAAALTTTIVPSIALGSPTATFTRATTATNTDWESIVRPALSGEVRFQGARRVQNFLTFTEALTNAAWATINATILNNGDGFWSFFGGGATRADIFQETPALLGQAWTCASDFKELINGSATVYIGIQEYNGGAFLNQTLTAVSVLGAGISATPKRFAVSRVLNQATVNKIRCFIRVDNDGTTHTIAVARPQLENVTGQSNQSPGEYVSVSVLSAPFQGANVDGVQYFGTLNGNTVASNVVTAGNGATIPSATLLGYLAEGARTNLSLSSTFLATWAPTRATLTASAVVSPDGATAGATLVEDATATNTHFIAQVISTTAATVYTWSVWGKTGPGSKRWLALNSDLINVGFEQGIVDLSNCTVSQQAFGSSVTVKTYPNGWCYITASGAARATAGLNFQFMLANAASGAGAITYNGDNTSGNAIWGAQVEAGAFASSYIPTALATVTRNADTLTYPAAGNMSASIGTAYAEVSAAPNQVTVLSFVGTSTLGRLLESSAQDNIRCIDSATNIAIKNPLTPYSSTVAVKRASSWSVAGGMSVTGDGATPAKSAFASMDVGNPIGIGCFGAGGNQTNGTIRNVLIFPAQFTDAQLQGKTGP